MRRTAQLLTAALTVPLLVLALCSLPGAARAASPLPTSFAFTGGGWGHGVGMSQYGALGMASEGRSADQILRHYYTGATVGPYADAKRIRVNLHHRAVNVKFRTEALASGGGGISLNLGSKKVHGSAGDVFKLKLKGNQVSITKNGVAQGTAPDVVVRWSGTWSPSTTSGDDTRPAVLNVIPIGSKFATGGHRYRYGYVKVSALTAGGATRLEVVNVVDLHDEYLRGIAEMPSSWPAAALQAQVIAARSYALVKRGAGKRSSCDCHVDSGVSDQVFAGYVKESSAYGAAWRAAVTATASSATTGRTVLYQGKPAQAFYSSSTGGRTQSSKDVWGGDVPYLTSVDDHWSTSKTYNPTYAEWGPLTRTQAQVAAAFGLPDVASLDLTARYVSGALRSATATSSKGKKATLSVGGFVARLGLTSNWVRRAVSTVPGNATNAAVETGKATAPASRTAVIAPSKKSLSYLANVAAPLAAARNAPLLLSGRNKLPAKVRADLKRRGTTKVYLVGAKSQLSTKLRRQVAGLGISVSRLGGKRYALSVRVAKAMGVGKGTRAFAVSGSDRPSALIASAPAARLKRPLLLVKKRSVPKVVRKYLRTLAPKRTFVVGSKSRVSTATLRKLPRAKRISGATAPATSVAVAKRFSAAMAPTSVVLAPTARVTAARATAAYGVPVLLTPKNLDGRVRGWLQANPRVTRVRALSNITAARTITAARNA